MWKSDDSEIGPFPFRNWFYQGSNFPHDCFSITTQNNICTPIQFRQKLLRWAFAIRNLKSFSEAKRKSLAPFFQLEAQYHELPHRNFVIICILKTLISIISVKHFIVLTWTQKNHGLTFSLGLSSESVKKSALPSIVERSHCIDRQAWWYKRNHKILFGGLNNENVNFLLEVMAHQSNWQCIGIKHLHLVLSILYLIFANKRHSQTKIQIQILLEHQSRDCQHCICQR